MPREFCHATVLVFDGGNRKLVIEGRQIAGELTLASDAMPEVNRNGQTIRVFFQTQILDGVSADSHKQLNHP